MLEKEIEKKVCDYAKKLNFLVYKFSSPSNKGVPDRIFISPSGKVFFIEFKGVTGRLTAIQEHCIEELQSYNQSVYVVNDAEKGKRVIDEYL